MIEEVVTETRNQLEYAELLAEMQQNQRTLFWQINKVYSGNHGKGMLSGSMLTVLNTLSSEQKANVIINDPKSGTSSAFRKEPPDPQIQAQKE